MFKSKISKHFFVYMYVRYLSCPSLILQTTGVNTKQFTFKQCLPLKPCITTLTFHWPEYCIAIISNIKEIILSPDSGMQPQCLTEATAATIVTANVQSDANSNKEASKPFDVNTPMECDPSLTGQNPGSQTAVFCL